MLVSGKASVSALVLTLVELRPDGSEAGGRDGRKLDVKLSKDGIEKILENQDSFGFWFLLAVLLLVDVSGATDVVGDVGGGKFSARFCLEPSLPPTKNQMPPPTITAKIMKKRMAFL